MQPIITFNEALRLYKECESFENGNFVGDNSPLRLKTQLVFGKSYVHHMKWICSEVYRVLANQYVKDLEEDYPVVEEVICT